MTVRGADKTGERKEGQETVTETGTAVESVEKNPAGKPAEQEPGGVAVTEDPTDTSGGSEGGSYDDVHKTAESEPGSSPNHPLPKAIIKRGE